NPVAMTTARSKIIVTTLIVEHPDACAGAAVANGPMLSLPALLNPSRRFCLQLIFEIEIDPDDQITDTFVPKARVSPSTPRRGAFLAPGNHRRRAHRMGFVGARTAPSLDHALSLHDALPL